MIKSFRQKALEHFWITGKSKTIPGEMRVCLLDKLTILHHARVWQDLRVPPGNHLHALRGNREGQWAISVNGPWRLCFRFEGGHAYDVELVQYH